MALQNFEAYKKDREKYLKEILENEQLYSEDPSLYFRKVRTFRLVAFFGFGMAVAIVAALAGLTAFFFVKGGGLLGFVGLFFAFVLGYLIYLLCKRDRSEEYVDLRREASPKLFDLVESICTEQGGVRFDSIRIVTRWTAEADGARRSIFSREFSNYLVLGLPLLEILDEKEVEAAIAHEVGHFKGSHYEKVHKLSQALAVFDRLMVAISETWLRYLFKPFAEYLNVRYQVLLHAVRLNHEREADRACLERVGMQVFQSLMMRLYAYGPSIEKLMRGDQIKELGQDWPGFDHLLETIRRENKEAIGGDLLRDLNEKTHPYDSHPSLTDRLKRAGVEDIPTSLADCEKWVREDLDQLNAPAIDFFFEDAARTELRARLEKVVQKNLAESSHPYAPEYLENPPGSPIDPTERVDLDSTVTGKRWREYRARLRATEIAFGRGELHRRIAELRDSPNPFHQFLAVNLAWNADKALYGTVLERLITSEHYRHYAATLLFYHYESEDRLPEAGPIYEAFIAEREHFIAVNELFSSGPRSLDIRQPRVPQDLVDYLSGELSATKGISAAYLIEMRPINSTHAHSPVVIIDFLSRREVFFRGDLDWSGVADSIRYAITCPFLCRDLGQKGRRWRRTVRKPIALQLVAPRNPVRPNSAPWWLKWKSSN